MTERRLTVLEARRDFGNLVLDALSGSATVITRYGKPAAMLVPVPEHQNTRTRAEQISDYFRLLVSLADKAEDKGRREDLFDRIERTIAAMAIECASAEVAP